jgi:hypothetical protein
MMDAMRSLGEEDIGKIMSQITSMGGGMPGMGGGMPGMGGGMPGMGGGGFLGDAFGDDDAGTLAGLDDLSEDD